MTRIYYKDHDRRYAHIHPKDRWKYPDEIRIGGFRYKRDKVFKDIRETHGLEPILLAKDVPITKGLYDGGS